MIFLSSLVFGQCYQNAFSRRFAQSSYGNTINNGFRPMSYSSFSGYSTRILKQRNLIQFRNCINTIGKSLKDVHHSSIIRSYYSDSGGPRYERNGNHYNKFNNRRTNNQFKVGSMLMKPDFSLEKLSKLEKNVYNENSDTKIQSDEAVSRFYADNSITVEGDSLKPLKTFEELTTSLPKPLIDAMTKKGFETPSLIQSVTLPEALSGKNVIGIAQTGSGKTACYVLPAFTHVMAQRPILDGAGPMCLILCPTRELAQQVNDVVTEFRKLGKLYMRSCCLYGGAAKEYQIRSLSNNPQICVATPGRLLDLLESQELTLRNVSYVVLDEADRMLDMGFEPQIRSVLDQIRPDKQTLMFSATWPKEIRALAREFMPQYTKITIGPEGLNANPNVKQYIEVVEDHLKFEKLLNLLETIVPQEGNKTLIFLKTKRVTDIITRHLEREGWPVACIHGDKSQRYRDLAMRNFRSGDCQILLATDVAARGLDISDVTDVINYDFPDTVDGYVHRIGRTARHNNKGTSHTFFTRENEHLAADLIQVLQKSDQNIPDSLIQFRHGKNTSKFPLQRRGVRPRFGGQTSWKRKPYRQTSESSRYDGKHNLYLEQ